MMTTGALLHGDVARHLDFNPEEHPVALQLGGSDPAELAHCARLGERWGYDEINLNCGCPCERVQRGAFGACLMAEPELVADCVKAMRDAVAHSGDGQAPHRHRPQSRDYGFVRDFVGTVVAAGCDVFIVHARNAGCKGLSPEGEPRAAAAATTTSCIGSSAISRSSTIVINGGITTGRRGARSSSKSTA